MTPFVFRIVLLFCSLFALFTYGARALGNAIQSASPALANIDSCTLPCWNDITPGVTTLDQATAILDRSGYRKREGVLRTYEFIYYAPQGSGGCNVLLGFSERKSPPIIMYMNLMSCPESRMGDLAGMLGRPEGMVMEWQWGWGPTYRQNSVRVMSRQALFSSRWSPPMIAPFSPGMALSPSAATAS
jgi:hypothetical protein